MEYLVNRILLCVRVKIRVMGRVGKTRGPGDRGPFVRSFVGRRFLHLHCSKEALSPGPQGQTPAAEPKDSQRWIP